MKTTFLSLVLVVAPWRVFGGIEAIVSLCRQEAGSTLLDECRPIVK